jgi:hypothetical protein
MVAFADYHLFVIIEYIDCHDRRFRIGSVHLCVILNQGKKRCLICSVEKLPENITFFIKDTCAPVSIGVYNRK